MTRRSSSFESRAAVHAPSDRRLKTNIQPLKDAMGKLVKLRGVSYGSVVELKDAGLSLTSAFDRCLLASPGSLPMAVSNRRVSNQPDPWRGLNTQPVHGHYRPPTRFWIHRAGEACSGVEGSSAKLRSAPTSLVALAHCSSCRSPVANTYVTVVWHRAGSRGGAARAREGPGDRGDPPLPVVPWLHTAARGSSQGTAGACVQQQSGLRSRRQLAQRRWC